MTSRWRSRQSSPCRGASSGWRPGRLHAPTGSSWLNRIENQFNALRYFALNRTDHPTHKAQGSTIRRYTIWRNKNAADKLLKALASRVNAA